MNLEHVRYLSPAENTSECEMICHKCRKCKKSRISTSIQNTLQLYKLPKCSRAKHSSDNWPISNFFETIQLKLKGNKKSMMGL
jgi:hypothetical protein